MAAGERLKLIRMMSGELKPLGRLNAIRALIEKSEEIERATSHCDDPGKLRTLSKAAWWVKFKLAEYGVPLMLEEEQEDKAA